MVFKLDTSGQQTVLYTFTGGADGGQPSGVVRDPAGNLYGTTCKGGTAGFGVVFKLNAAGQETVLYTNATVISMPRLGGLHHRYAWREAA